MKIFNEIFPLAIYILNNYKTIFEQSSTVILVCFKL